MSDSNRQTGIFILMLGVMVIIFANTEYMPWLLIAALAAMRRFSPENSHGEKLIETPNIDKLAARGIRFDRFYTPAGVCSATRSSIIVGAMQTTFGIHNHRSGRPDFRGQSMTML